MSGAIAVVCKRRVRDAVVIVWLSAGLTILAGCNAPDAGADVDSNDSDTGTSRDSNDTDTETDASVCPGGMVLACNNGDVWQFNTCDGVASRFDNCEDCEICADLSETTAECRASEKEHYQQCGDDGNIHWFDSCDAEGAVATVCDMCSAGCQNISDTLAECGTPFDDFTPCEVVTVPDRSYDICIRGTCQSPGCGTKDCNVRGPHFPLTDTNQRLCYDDGTAGVIPCPLPGESYDGQDAQYGWDATHGEAERFERDTDFPDYPVVTDKVTGLSWQGCAAGLTGNSCDLLLSDSDTYDQQDALVYCDDLYWGGYTDWRLPDQYELQSILDLGRVDPAIETSVFPATESKPFWTSAIEVRGGIIETLSMNFADGETEMDAMLAAVRCVRSEPSSHYVRYERSRVADNVPVVEDETSALMWQGCAVGQNNSCLGVALAFTWSDAVSYCNGLSWGGYSDWRLPNVIELSRIVDNSNAKHTGDYDEPPAIDIIAFPVTPDGGFWSSTSSAGDAKNAWEVEFQFGSMRLYYKPYTSSVRCVRGVAP